MRCMTALGSKGSAVGPGSGVDSAVAVSDVAGSTAGPSASSADMAVSKRSHSSRALAGRSSGLLARQHCTTSSMAGEIQAALTVANGGGASVACANSTSIVSSP